MQMVDIGPDYARTENVDWSRIKRESKRKTRSGLHENQISRLGPDYTKSKNVGFRITRESER